MQPLDLYNLVFQMKKVRLRLTGSLALYHTANWHQGPPETRVPDSITEFFFPGHHDLNSSPRSSPGLHKEKEYVCLTLSRPWNVPTLLSPLHSALTRPLSSLPYQPGTQVRLWSKGARRGRAGAHSSPTGTSLVKSPGSRAQFSTTAKQKGDTGSIMYHEQDKLCKNRLIFLNNRGLYNLII